MLGSLSPRARRLVLLWVAASTPLQIWRASLDSFEAPKELALTAAAFAAAVSVLPGTGIPAAAVWPMAAFLALAAVSSLASPIPLTAWFGEYTSYQGWLHWLAWATLLLAFAGWLRDPRERRRALAAVALSLGVVSAYAVLQLAGLDPIPWGLQGPVLRSFSTAGNAYFLGSLLAPGVPLAFGLAVSARGGSRRLGWFGLGGLILAGLLSSGSRSALGAAILGCLPGALLLRRDLVRPLVVAVSVPVVLGLVALPADRNPFPLLAERFGEVLRGGDARPQIWASAARLIRQRPLVGHGPDTFATLSLGVQTRRLWTFLWHAAPEKAHNEPLQMGATVGLLGLGALLWLAAILARLALATRRVPDSASAGGGLLALGFTSLFGFLTCGPQAVALPLAAVLLSRLPVRPLPRPATASIAAVLALSLFAHLQFASADVALRQAISRQGSGLESALRLGTPWAQRLLRAGDTLERLWFGGTLGSAPAAAAPRRIDSLRGIYTRACAVNPLHPFAWSDLGRLAAREGRWTEADEDYRRARALAPMDAYLALEHAQALLGAGRDADAIAVLEEAAALYPSFAEPVGLLGYAALRKGRLKEAEPWLTKSLDLDWHGNLGAAYAAAGNLSALYHKLGREDDARWAATQAQRFMPPQPF